MDARVVKTRQAFRQALFALLDHKPITQITVAELCRQAKVTRRTFYIHYDRVTDIFTDYQNDLAAQVQEAMSGGRLDADALLTIFDRILMANFKAFRYLCLHPQAQDLVSRLQEMLYQTFSANLVGAKPTPRQQLILQYAASGLINAYVFWFNHEATVDYPTVVQTNRELLALTVRQLARD